MKRTNCLVVACLLASGLAFSSCTPQNELYKQKNFLDLSNAQEISIEAAVDHNPYPIALTSSGNLSNLYTQPNEAFSIRYNDSWIVDTDSCMFQKHSSSLLFYNMYAIADTFIGDMNDYSELMKASVVEQEYIKDYTFSTHQSDLYYIAEYSYETNNAFKRWTVICDTDKQMALMFLFTSPTKAEYDELLPQADAMLASVNIMAAYQPELATTLEGKSAREIDRQTAIQNVSSNGMEFIGRWGIITEDGVDDLRIQFNADGSFIRYKSYGDERNYVKGTWNYIDGNLILYVKSAVYDGESSSSFSPEVEYELLSFVDGCMTILNSESGKEFQYCLLDN